MAEPRVVLMNVATALGDRHVDLITRERWEAITAPFPLRMRGRVANLAAHNYTIYAVDGALLITHPYGAGEVWRIDGTTERFCADHNDVLFPPSVDQQKPLRMRDARVQRADGSFHDRLPSEDAMWALVHAGAFARSTLDGRAAGAGGEK